MRRVKFKAVRIMGERRFSAYACGDYCLNYLKNSIVRARRGTIGIAVFGRKGEAKKFCEGTNFEIIQVLPVGRGKTVKVISGKQSDNMLDFFYRCLERHQGIPRDSDFIPMAPPRGTMFYPAVEVLD